MSRKETRFVPGPNNYNIPAKTIEGPQITMHAKLKTADNAKRNNCPAPGAYNTQDNFFTKHQSPIFSMGTGQRTNFGKRVNVPGPGNYENIITTAKNNGPKFGFGSS